MIITPYKITNPSYAYTNTTTTKQQHPYPHLRIYQNKDRRKRMLNLF